MAEHPAPAGTAGRLDDEQIPPLLQRLDEALAQLEQAPGSIGESAMHAVSMLTAVYGEALARVVDRAAAAPQVLAALGRDELLAHLLALHDVHPEPVEERVRRAIESLAPTLHARGAHAEVVSIADGVATLRLGVDGCGCSAGDATDAVRAAVSALAPSLTEVRVEKPEGEATFVPLDSLRRRPTATEPAR